MNRIWTLARNSDGATSIEYAAVASLISVVAIGAVGTIGASVTSFFGSIPSF
jgi:Flp pilus assembly pilin Flp